MDLCEQSPSYIRAIAPYQPGKPISELAREMGLDEKKIIKLASNENPLGVSPKAKAAIKKALPELGRYPDGNAFELKAALSRRYGVPEECIVVGNGSNDLLEMAAGVFLAPGRAAVYSQHAFAVYPLATQARGAKSIVVPARNYGHDLPAMLAAITPDTRVVFIANPNNPTGTFVPGGELEDFLSRTPRDVAVVVDEAYTEYLSPELRYDSVGWLKKYANLVLTRTFSKVYGLAGLRVGFGLMHPRVADLFNRVRQPCELLRASARRQTARGQGVREASAPGSHREACLRLRHARPSARHGRHAERERKIPQGAGYGAGGVMARIEKLVVVGVGLVGGSFALALKEAGAVGRVIGVGRGARNIQRALELKIIDAPGALDAATLGDADLVLLAVPVGQMQPVMRAIAPFLGAKTVVTDAGSTKQDVVELARRELKGSLSRFVPGHPIAGTEKSGAEAAFAGLYRGRKVVLTPLKNNDPGAIALVRSSWESCGANVFEMKPKEHDAVLATVSHLPHLLAYALVDQVARDKDAERLFSYAAGGFRDFTRIASSHPEMWRDICLANREALLADLKRYGAGLDKVRAALRRGDAKALDKLFSGAREARERWLKDAQ